MASSPMSGFAWSRNSPAVVVSALRAGAVALRPPGRVRSNGAAQMNAAASASINSWYRVSVATRIRSADVGELEFPEQLEEGSLVKSHRALCPSVRFLDSSL